MLIGQGSGRNGAKFLFYPGWVSVGASLALRFDQDRSWVVPAGGGPSDAIDGDISDIVTTTRASTATYFDADGVMQTAPANTWRRDYDPLTGQGRGVLIEEQRTNLLTYSSGFTQSVWQKFRVSVTANAAVAPDGTLTASLITEDTTASVTHTIQQGQTRPAGTESYLSVYVKKAPAGRRYITFQSGTVSNQNQWSILVFDFDTGTFIVSGSALATGTAEQLPDGWWRLSAYTVAKGTGAVTFGLYLMSGATTTTYDGDGVSGVYIWGGQWEDGSSTSSHIPTTTAAATRAADLPTTDTAPWFNPAQGSLVMELYDDAPLAGVRRYYLGLTVGNSTSQYLGISKEITGIQARALATASSLAPVHPFTAGRHKIAMSYGPDGVMLSVDGNTTLITPTAPGNFSDITKMRIGGHGNSTGVPSVRVLDVQYYPRQPTASELQSMSVPS